jgi:hypothetical protein
MRCGGIRPGNLRPEYRGLDPEKLEKVRSINIDISVCGHLGLFLPGLVMFRTHFRFPDGRQPNHADDTQTKPDYAAKTKSYPTFHCCSSPFIWDHLI